MIKLSVDNYSKVIPLLLNVPFNTLFAEAVVENKVEGDIFVDHSLSPTVALIIHKYGMSLLCGSYKNIDFNKKLVGFLSNNSLNNRSKWMITYPESWELQLEVLLDKKLIRTENFQNTNHMNRNNYIVQTQRVNFKFTPDLFSYNCEVPPKFILKKINSSLYEKIYGSVIPQNFWNSKEDFLQKGIGFILLYEDQFVSTCFSSFIKGNHLELGVETAENFRHKGLAVYAASELIRFCIVKGYEPVWACREENIGSFKLAKKLGFQPLSFHNYYCIHNIAQQVQNLN